MRKYILPVLIFGLGFLIYFAVSTNFTFKPKWALDYFNPLAQSLLKGRLDLVNPPSTYDLAYLNGKWYAPWGVLPSVFLLIPQLMLKRFVPAIYLTVLFAVSDILLMYLMLRRIKKEFLPEFSDFAQLLVLALFAFGTVHFYVGTLGSVWHVDQMVSAFFGTLGIFAVIKKNRQTRDYLLSAWAISLALLGRATLILLIIFPAFLFLWNNKPFFRFNAVSVKKGILIFVPPLILFSGLFFLYNYLRFQNPFEYGYSYIKESPYLAQLRLTLGTMSVTNIPRNLWYMLFEIPSLTFDGALKLGFNLNGNSIFFLTPPFLAVFLAGPVLRRGRKLILDPYISALWLTAIVTIIPSLMIYSSGWMQFSYRYSLDITVLLILLTVFGMRGKLNFLFVTGTVFSVTMYILGIRALM